jgi:hypothetical protein
MPGVTIYVFKDPRDLKAGRADMQANFHYTELPELFKEVARYFGGRDVYHVSAFSPYGHLVYELYLGPKMKGGIA